MKKGLKIRYQYIHWKQIQSSSYWGRAKFWHLLISTFENFFNTLLFIKVKWKCLQVEWPETSLKITYKFILITVVILKRSIFLSSQYYRHPNKRSGRNNSSGWKIVWNWIIVMARIIVVEGKFHQLSRFSSIHMYRV